MSEGAGKSSLPAFNGKGFRRRRPRPGQPRKPKTELEGKPQAESEEAPPRREHVENVPVPDHLVGTKQEGTVVITVRNRRFNFGFIALAVGEDAANPTIPRVYYNPSCIAEADLNLYRGYEVGFTIEKDEEGRAVAKNIALTENGKKIKVERDAEAQVRKQERQERRVAEQASEGVKEEGEGGAAGGRREERREPAGGADGGRRLRRPPPGDRPPRGGVDRDRPKKFIKFLVKAEGSSETKELNFQVYNPIGRLKSMACRLVEAPMDMSVYLVNAANPSGVFITRVVLNEAEDGDTILVIPKRLEDNLEEK